MAKQTPQPAPVTLAVRVSSDDADRQITERMEKGRQILEWKIESYDQLKEARNQYKIWDDFNEEMLRQMFTTQSMAYDYQGGGSAIVLTSADTLNDEVSQWQGRVETKIVRLESIKERLKLLPTLVDPAPVIRARHESSGSYRVFVVHGHNEYLREAVARFLEKLGLEAVVLGEQPNAGKTLIEKFEAYTDVGFAIVLLTADDVGAPKDTPDKLKLRARQNVILELGYFIGRLERERTCAIYEEDVELPSDMNGVVYIPFDKREAWKRSLVKELKFLDFPIKLENAF